VFVMRAQRRAGREPAVRRDLGSVDAQPRRRPARARRRTRCRSASARSSGVIQREISTEPVRVEREARLPRRSRAPRRAPRVVAGIGAALPIARVDLAAREYQSPG